MKTLVCLPTYNEIKSVEPMIDRIRNIGLDLILCDQNSTDGTVEKAGSKSVPVYQRDGYGKGWGVRKALEVAGMVHQSGLKSNCTMLFVHVERPEHWVDHLLKLREQQDKTGGFQCFIPLAIPDCAITTARFDATLDFPSCGPELVISIVFCVGPSFRFVCILRKASAAVEVGSK